MKEVKRPTPQTANRAPVFEVPRIKQDKIDPVPSSVAAGK